MQIIVKLTTGEEVKTINRSFQETLDNSQKEYERLKYLSTGDGKELVEWNDYNATQEILEGVQSMMDMVQQNGVRKLDRFRVDIDDIPTWFNPEQVMYIQFVGIDTFISDLFHYVEKRAVEEDEEENV